MSCNINGRMATRSVRFHIATPAGSGSLLVSKWNTVRDDRVAADSGTIRDAVDDPRRQVTAIVARPRESNDFSQRDVQSSRRLGLSDAAFMTWTIAVQQVCISQRDEMLDLQLETAHGPGRASTPRCSPLWRMRRVPSNSSARFCTM